MSFVLVLEKHSIRTSCPINAAFWLDDFEIRVLSSYLFHDRAVLSSKQHTCTPNICISCMATDTQHQGTILCLPNNIQVAAYIIQGYRHTTFSNYHIFYQTAKCPLHYQSSHHPNSIFILLSFFPFHAICNIWVFIKKKV